jgi:hypothetical protein
MLGHKVVPYIDGVEALIGVLSAVHWAGTRPSGQRPAGSRPPGSRPAGTQRPVCKGR